MTTITLRNTKGTPLTNTELDANFSNLNTAKAELASPTFTGTVSGITAAMVGAPTTTGTGASGTWAININGTIGATTPAAGSFTVLSASGTISTSGALETSGSSGGFGANKWFIQKEIVAPVRSYACGPDASTSLAWEHYTATSTGSPSRVFRADSTGFAVTGALSATGSLTLTGASTGFQAGDSASFATYGNALSTTYMQMFGSTSASANVVRWVTGSTELMRLDASGNLGLGVVPSAWGDDKAIQLPQGSVSSGYEYGISVAAGAYRSASNVWRYTQGAASVSRFNQVNGAHQWFTAPSGTAGQPITFTQAMTLDATGKLNIASLTASKPVFTDASDNLTSAGTLGIDQGGTGATTAALARTGLGATTLGANLFTLTNVAAIAFPRINADNTVSSLDAATFRTAIGAGTSSTAGTVTSVGGTGTVSGLTLSGTVTASGNLTLGGTLAVTAANFASQTANTFLSAPTGVAGVPTFRAIVAADIPTLNQSTTGSAATLTTARAITIGNTGKSFNGSAAVTWSHSELGTVRNFGVVAVQGVIGSSVECTTAQFITWLTTLGAFLQTASVMKCSWDYAGNNDISDTGFGSLETAGCIIETFTDNSQYIIRVTSPSTGLGAGGIHEYINHGAGYSPGWRRVYTSNLNGNISGTAANVTGTVAVANGGTGATTAALARTGLGATTLGANLFTLTNVAAIAFPRINADNTVSSLDAATFRTAIGAGTSSTTGTVTSVTGTAPVVSSGGTTPAISMAAATTSVSGYLTSTDWNTFNGKQAAGSYLTSSTGVTTIAGGTTGLTPAAATSGAVTLAGTLAIANGGTGATTAALARTGLGASTLGANLFTLTNVAAIAFPRINADNTVSSLDAATFRTAIGAGTSSTTGTVTSVGGTGTVSGLSLSGTVTASGNLTLGGTLSTSVDNITDEHRLFNNMGDIHNTRTSFDATIPSYNFGWRFVQGSVNGPNVNSSTQYYSLYVGLGNEYLATGAGSYGMQLSIPRNVTLPYLSIRYNENNSLASWQKISAGYSDTAGNATTVSSITSGQVTTALGYTPASSGRTVSVISTNTTAVAGTTYVITADITLTLPASPVAGNSIDISNLSNSLTCIVARNSQNIMNLAEDLTLDINASITLVFADATRGWIIL